MTRPTPDAARWLYVEDLTCPHCGHESVSGRVEIDGSYRRPTLQDPGEWPAPGVVDHASLVCRGGDCGPPDDPLHPVPVWDRLGLLARTPFELQVYARAEEYLTDLDRHRIAGWRD